VLCPLWRAGGFCHSVEVLHGDLRKNIGTAIFDKQKGEKKISTETFKRSFSHQKILKAWIRIQI
jgi:hypothetical protein